ncbi:8-oxo-dGTP pyrophosphatase MutT (NUDIX family) [Nonomuraea thailandensis]|uniref:8-oxo-dGTP pyrophosphatase MutT (NUDIX family) n=1 Tax=Nonomuraea thailandensis TaxID=1188745 RepID=A0A9X2GMJ6_9ACTN|nr:NUDIX domain-containing protein [Nonomuraea thailandensis]MCP2361611.1 8-oxo-dGTP pyrophosphatase MutT (NUDIX family) [Nonomuraea thailandensis]
MPPIADESRELVRALVEEMTPHDGREAADLKWTLDWVDSGAPLFRVAKPATPPCHLVAYAALVDRGRASVMLVDHLKARAWLPPGGHVDPGEDPRRTVLREVEEELGIAGRFHPVLGSAPFFLTVTRTRGADAHTDVSLWFVLEGDQQAPITPDLAEFAEVRWFALGGGARWAPDRFDPEMSRFVAKLEAGGFVPGSGGTEAGGRP